MNMCNNIQNIVSYLCRVMDIFEKMFFCDYFRQIFIFHFFERVRYLVDANFDITAVFTL